MTSRTASLPDAPIGKLLRRWRHLNSVKQAALAADLGVTQATLSRWETGKRHPTGHVALRLRELLTARPTSAADRALLQLVCGAASPVHLICDSTHRLLAASPSRAARWQAGLRALMGQSLWPYASDAIVRAEHALANSGWYDEAIPADILIETERACFPALTIPAGQVLWTRMSLSDGSFARLVRDGPKRTTA